MKALNFIDLGVQTFILGVVTIIGIICIFAGQLEALTMLAMYAALFLGPWQFVSSLITTLSRGLYLRWRVIHLLSSIGYFILAGVAAYFFSDLPGDGWLRITGGFFGFGIPIALALFYYYITIKSFQLARAGATVKQASV